MDFVVQTSNLTRKFGSFTAVDAINLAIPAGQVCGFLGPNGAGKSTAMRMLCGILAPTSGSGTILGHDIAVEAEAVKKKIGYMSQKFSLYEDLTVMENLQFYAGLYSLPAAHRVERIQETLDMAWLKGRENELVAGLSRGFKQRLALGCAVIAEPPLVFLDEPTSGVSPTTRREFFNLIQEMALKGSTVIVSTHFMDEAERCDQIVFFNQGQVIAMDHPDALKEGIIQGLLVEVLVDQPMETLEKILLWPFVVDASLHGSLLHIRIKDQASLDLLAERLGTVPNVITPSLEDVFIYLTREDERKLAPQ